MSRNADLPQVTGPAPRDWRVDGMPLRLILLAMALMLLSTAVVLAWWQWQDEKKQAWERTRHVSELLALSTEQTLDTHLANLRALAPTIADPALRGDYAQVMQVFRVFKDSYPVLAGLSLVAPDGQILMSTLSEGRTGVALPRVQDIPGFMDSFSRIIAPTPSLSLGPVKSRLNNEWVIPLRYALRDAAGKPLFVVSALLSVKGMAATLQSASAEQGTVHLLMNTAGHRVLRAPMPADPDNYFSQPGVGGLAESLRANPGARGGHYLAAPTSVDVSMIGAYTKLKNYDLAAAASLPADGLWTSWRKGVTLPLATLGLLSVAAMIAAFMVGRAEQRHRAVRLAAAERVRESDERLSLAIEGGQVAIWEADIASGGVYLDRGWERIAGLPIDGTRMTWAQLALLMSPPDLGEIEVRVKLILKGDVDAFHEEIRLQVHPGEWRWFAVRGRVAARDAAGHALTCAGTATDITQRKNTGAAVEAARFAAEADSRAKSVFFANLGHEIRTPIHGVLGMAEVLTHSGLTQDQNGLVAAIRGSSNHLMQLVENLLDFSRLEAGRLKLDIVSFDLRGAVDLALQPLRKQAQEKGLAFHCEIAPVVPQCIRADPVRFNQILAEVAGNAVKFTEQGRIDIKVSVVRHPGDAATLHFSVTDSGIGISPDVQAHVFEAFIQAESGAARKYGGTGLGLNLSKTLVELMGGNIQLMSTADAGSVFHYTLQVGVVDVADYRAAAGAPVPDTSALPPGVKVLVVDDNAVNRQVAKGLLQALKCDVDVVVDGMQAVAASAAKSYDAVLMDCFMPEMDGYAATARIREREKASNAPRVPIIALTANALPGSRESCIAAGMDDFVTKPCTRADLERVLARWVTRRVEQTSVAM